MNHQQIKIDLIQKNVIRNILRKETRPGEKILYMIERKTVIYHTRMTPIGSGYLLNKTDIYLIMKRNKHLYMHVFNLDMTSKYC